LEEVFMNSEREKTSRSGGRPNRGLGGAALILLGLIFLAGQFFDLPSIGQLFLPALGLVFLVWGVFARNSGLLIPGGILGGIGTGIYLMDTLPLEGAARAGIFLVVFGAGFGLMALLSILFTPEKHWWALWPFCILGLIGAMMIAGGAALAVVEFAGKFWPVAVIAIGLYLIIRRR
jgi:hypothetical protein